MAWVFPVITGIAEVMSTITFIQFIEEEACQTASLGAFMAIRSRHYAAAKPCLDLIDDELVPHLKSVNETIGHLAPYSQGCFRDYIRSAQENTKVLRELCNL